MNWQNAQFGACALFACGLQQISAQVRSLTKIRTARLFARLPNAVLNIEFRSPKAVNSDNISSPSMPSGNTHDAVTIVLIAPVAAAGYYVTGSFAAAIVLSAAFLFGGLMFGPDLDTGSKQQNRWRFFRFLWLPYRVFFKHRSRWTHGLIFGTLFRVVYFMGVTTLVLLTSSFLSAVVFGTPMPRAADLAGAWSDAGSLVRLHAGGEFVWVTFAGLWAGAATHTFADMAGSYIKTGRSGGFL